MAVASLGTAQAQVPQLISYQGRITVDGTNFHGSGLFKFALVGANGAAPATYWSNDGTGRDGNPPAAAVALKVDRGLYSVLLGDATLANMQPIPAVAFTNTAVWLRIWFNDGTLGFSQLIPDQRVAAVGYAMIAGLAATVPDGAITSAKLAAGAVGASQLAAGAVGAPQLAAGAVGTAQLAESAVTGAKLASGAVAAQNLAPGAVGPAQLARRYDAGRVDTGSLSLNLADDGTCDINIAYHTFFAAAPILTYGVEAAAGEAIPQIALAGKTQTNFSLRLSQVQPTHSTVYDRAATITLDTGSDYGLHSSLARANGRPAIGFFDRKKKALFYIQAIYEPDGRWKTPMLLDAGPAADMAPALAIVDGRPAMAYWIADDSGNTALKYVRALDADGDSWSQPLTLASNDIGPVFSLQVAAGNPAIAFHTQAGGNLKLIRAQNSAGSAWGTPVVVDNTRACQYPSLCVVDNNPAIAYQDRNETTLCFIRASDTLGATWGSATVLDRGQPINATRGAWASTVKTHQAGQYASLAMIDGHPAVAYQAAPMNYGTNASEVRYLHASNASGTSWPVVPKLPMRGWPAQNPSLHLEYMGQHVRLQEIGASAYLTFRYYGYAIAGDQTPSDLAVCRGSLDAYGLNWWASAQRIFTGNATDFCVAQADPSGKLGCSYYDQGRLRLQIATLLNGAQWPASGNIVPLPQLDLTGLLGQVQLNDGTPLVLFHDPAKGDLKSIKAANNQGTQWSATTQTVDSGGNAGLHTAMVSLKAAIALAYRDEYNRTLKLVLLRDGRWGNPVSLAPKENLDWPSLAEVDGTPGLAAVASGASLVFARALSENAGAWQKFIVLDANVTSNAAPSLAVVNGKPAIAYAGARLSYVRASDADGIAWSAPVAIGSQPAGHPSLAEVNGRPAIAYYDGGLHYVRAKDAAGTAWQTPVKVDITAKVGEFASLKVINGWPAMAYYDRSNGNLKFVRAADPDGTTWSTPLTVDSGGDVGLYACLVETEANPAISYWAAGPAPGFKVVRAASRDGTSWGTPALVDQGGTVGEFGSLVYDGAQLLAAYYDRSNGSLKAAREGWTTETVDGGAMVGQYLSAAVLGGYACVSYYDRDHGSLKFNRAASASAASWGTPRTLDDTGDVGLYSSLAEVNGTPAVAYYDATLENLKFTRATGAAGSAWSAPVVVDATNNVGPYASLAVVNSRPAIAYYDVTLGDLKYVRASDANGAAWGTPVTPDPGDVGQDVGKFASLAVVNGRPAIAYYDAKFSELKYIRANDAEGAAWGDFTALDKPDDVGLYITLKVINGKPAIVYYNQTQGDLKMIRARDADGRSWNPPVTLQADGDSGRYAVLGELSGNPSVTYWDNTNGRIKNYHPFKPFQLNWFAIEP